MDSHLQYKQYIDAALGADLTLLEITLLETTLLETKSIAADVRAITASFDKSKAPLKAVIASIASKLVYPDWDTRKHQTQIGGDHSLRSIDSNIVCPYLYEKGYYPTATPFALTRSFEKAEEFNSTYTGNISPPICKTAFLNIVHVINTTPNPALCKAILAFCLQFLKQRKEKIADLRAAIVTINPAVNLNKIQILLTRIFAAATTGISAVPPIAMHTACVLVQPYMWPGCTINPLNSHTAADGHTNAHGDVDGCLANGTPFLAVEVKHNIPINPTLIATFEAKSVNIPLRYMITTNAQETQVTASNIRISTVTDAILGLLHSTLFHKNTIAVEYATALQTAILAYETIGLTAKEAIAPVFTEVLA